jgi:integrase
MPRAKLKLTEARINRLPASSRTVFCGELKGFGVRVREADGTRTFTFVVQRDIPRFPGSKERKTKKVTYPHKGKHELARAREWAKDIIRAMERGEDPTELRTSCTLRAALEKHLKGMQNRGASPASLRSLRYNVEHYAGALLDRDLASIERRELEQLHDAISERGKYVANTTLRQVQTLFNTARKKMGFDHLDKEVTAAVDYHKQERRRDPVPDLASWWDAVEGIRNTVRRDLWWFVLFTGLRRDDAKTVRWEHVDFDNGTIHRPKPKGGTDRAFTVPVSKFVLDLLRNRQAENSKLVGADDGWVFPAVVRRNGRVVVTHVVEVKEQVYYRDADGKQRKRAHPVMRSAHRLRDTFASVARDAGVDWLALKVLMNHALPSGDVTAGYVLPGLHGLRTAAEKVASLLLKRAGRAGYAATSAGARSSVG